MLACLALGAVLLGVRAGGAAVGWAFQLQDPRVILFLLLLVAAITLNLAGLFELPSLGGRLAGGGADAFSTGALAAFVATPCAGPFLGAALRRRPAERRSSGSAAWRKRRNGIAIEEASPSSTPG